MIQKLSLTLFAASALVFAQAPGTTNTPPAAATLAQMQVNRLAAQLNLTDAQKATALSIFTTAITNAQTIQMNLQTNRQSLRDAIKTNNAAAIDQLSAAAGTLTGQLTAIHSKAEAAFYAILTADQKTLYDARPHGGPGGRGGMGGPGGDGRGGMMRGRRG